MMRIKKLGFFCSVMAIILVFFGCSTFNTPPTQQEAEVHLQEDYDSLQVICQYFIGFGENDVHILEDGRSVLVDLKVIEIQDLEVLSAIQELKDKGYRMVAKNDDTIYFEIWSGIRDISSGIACSLNGASDISVQFVTE